MKTVDREKLWGEYQKNPSSALREKLITEYAPLVKVVAGRLSMYLGYNVEYEDLVSYGIFGLIDAIDKFDPGKDVKFETYASLRIRGSILDQIRKMDWIPRTVRQKQKRIEEAIKNIEARTGRAAADEEIAGLEIKYSKLTMVPDSTLMIGDIIASGETLIHCLRYVTDFYRKNGAKLRNIIIFTIGGTKGIEILENLTREIREFWPEFEGFITVYYEGIFSTYQDKGVSGINLPDVDFYWKDGIIAPEFRRETLSMCSPLFEKCIIYDGGARRYEIHEHVEEVLEFWEGIKERADKIDFKELLDEKIGYPTPISYEDWIEKNHYEKIRPADTKWLYRQEQGYIESMKNITLKELADQRITEFTDSLKKYML
jgi:RNA polymerase sigma factor (sigma-70 family)